MTPSEEKAYIEGERAVARNVLQFALRLVRENGGKTDGAEAVKVLSETEAALKRLCGEHEIEVPENLHPADIVEKRIGRHLTRVAWLESELDAARVREAALEKERDEWIADFRGVARQRDELMAERDTLNEQMLRIVEGQESRSLCGSGSGATRTTTAKRNGML